MGERDDAPLAVNYPAALLRARQQARVPVSMVRELVLRVTNAREIVSALYAKLIIARRIILRFPAASNTSVPGRPPRNCAD